MNSLLDPERWSPREREGAREHPSSPSQRQGDIKEEKLTLRPKDKGVYTNPETQTPEARISRKRNAGEPSAEDQRGPESGSGEAPKKRRGRNRPGRLQRRARTPDRPRSRRSSSRPVWSLLPALAPAPPPPTLCALAALPPGRHCPALTRASAAFTPMGPPRGRALPLPQEGVSLFPHLKLPRRARSLPPAGRGGAGAGGAARAARASAGDGRPAPGTRRGLLGRDSM